MTARGAGVVWAPRRAPSRLGAFEPVVAHERAQASAAMRGLMRVADLLASMTLDAATYNAIGPLLFVCGRDLDELGGNGR